MNWNPDELSAIDRADDLKIAPLREDGKTFGTPTWIWAVVVDGRLYVRAWNGPASRWYRAARARNAGQIRAAGATRDVTFEKVDDAALNDRIDDAYRTKYAGSAYLPPMVGAGPRSATVCIHPAGRSAGSREDAA